MRGSPDSAPTLDSPLAIADRFLDQHKQALGVQDVAGELQPLSAESDNLGMTHLRYQQLYQGVPVYGSQTLVHLGPDSAVRSANGRLVSAIALDTTPQISPDEAIALAQNYFSTSRLPDGTTVDPLAPSVTDSAAFLPTVEYVDLYVLNKGLLDNTDDPVSHLAWEVHLVQTDLGVNESYFLDAHTGELLEQLDGNRYLTRGVYDCSVGDGLCHINAYYSQYNYTFGRSEGKPPVGPNPLMGGSTDTDAVYDMLGFIHNDVLQARFGRNGGNGRGGIGDGKNFQLTSTMAYVFFEKFNPSFCSENFAGFTGYSLQYCLGQAVTDVIAHEYGHSITYFLRFDAQGRPVSMVYQGESGALQENFSDAFAAAVEYYRFGDCDWFFGEENATGLYRNLVDPPSAPTPPDIISYPDRYLSPSYYSGTNDYGGLHYNATILDKAFYLTAQGGQFNGYEVQGLGIDKAIHIWYRAVTQYYTTTETFNDAYYDLIQAATDLYSTADVDQVRKALQAVELNLTRPSSESQVTMIDQVTKPTPSVSSVSAHFIEDSNVAELLASPGGDGSITSAVSLVNLDDGPVPLDPAQFAYDAASRTLTLTSPTPMPAGNYQLQVRGDLLLDDQGRQLRGGTGGRSFSPPTFGAAQNVQAGGANLTVNSYASPSLADWNSDGRLDLVLGEQMADSQAKLRVYLNSGTAKSPKFTTFSYARSGGIDLAVPGGGSGVSSRLVDWNHDGLPDLILGLADGRVQFWPNVNTAADPQFGTPIDLEAGTPDLKSPVNVGAQAMVEVADWNDDGRMDLIVGSLDGRVRVYLDQAATGSPELRGPLVVQDGSADLIVSVGGAAPAVADLNGDGRKDLIVGDSQGRVLSWLNCGSDGEPQFYSWFPLVKGIASDWSPAMTFVPSARVTVGDWNGDGLPDLVFGAANGRVQTAPTLSRAAPAESDPWVGARGGTYLYNFYAPPPSPLSVTINQAADQADPTNGETVHFTVVFSEPVTDFAVADVTVSGTAGATQVSVGPATGNGMTYDVAISGIANDGTVIVSLASGVAHDAAGNANSASTSTDNRVIVDRIPLTVGLVPVMPDPRNTAVGAVRIEFSKAVTGVAVSTFRLTRNGQVVDLSGRPVTAVSSSQWTVDLSSITTAAGAYVLTLEATGTNIRDLAGNALAAGASETFVVHPRQNVRDVNDVNDDLTVTPLDVLMIVTEINTHGSGAVVSLADGLPPFPDVTGDDVISPIDVLALIAFINGKVARASLGEAEAGTYAAVGPASSVAPDPALSLPSAWPLGTAKEMPVARIVVVSLRETTCHHAERDGYFEDPTVGYFAVLGVQPDVSAAELEWRVPPRTAKELGRLRISDPLCAARLPQPAALDDVLRSPGADGLEDLLDVLTGGVLV
ncbi:MAG: M4 family metallopeptidase [Planctomycetota bacterium]|nr:M4 family metallopeptidase [Planctomycetota bacterium]